MIAFLWVNESKWQLVKRKRIVGLEYQFGTGVDHFLSRLSSIIIKSSKIKAQKG